MNLVIKEILPFIKKNKFIFILLFITSIGFSIDGIVSPYFLSNMIFSNHTQKNYYLILFLFSFIIGSIFIYFYRRLRIQFYQQIQPYFIKDKINKLIIKNEKQYQKEADISVFYNILQYSQVLEYIFVNIYEIIPFIIFFCIYLIILYYTSKINCLVILISFIIIIYLNIKFVNPQLIDKGIILSNSRNNLIQKLNNKHQNIIDLTSFNTIDKEQIRLQKKTDNFGTTIQKLLKIKHKYEQYSYFTLLIVILSIIYIYYKLLIEKKINKQIFCFIFLISLTYFYMFYRNYNNLTCIISYYAEIKRFHQLLKDYLNIDYRYLHTFHQYYKINSTDNIDNQNIIEIKNLYFKYHDKYILNNINITIPKYKITTIIGKIGCGKSTLIKLLFGIYQPNKGMITIHYNDKYNKKYNNNNKNIYDDKIDIRQWRDYIQYIPQFPQVFNKPMGYNLNYGNDNKNNKNNNNYPLFIKNITNRKDNNLSGGQKQILTLYRLLNKPKPIILLDEPTSALDKNNKKYLFQLIHKLKKQKSTIIIISHDKDMIKNSDNVINLSS